MSSEKPTATSGEAGRFGIYGGSYIPETLSAALDELRDAYEEVREDPAFWAEFTHR